ncbi:FAD:protein FMN transferase [Sphingomonas sp. PL-96]|uniref:FAD:protein FMN transferase n=1 Tax=Sphingomonas sp. PL-96 TaxID=2887201 RepID=UPI001E41104C|nr:FAD:protein FMN transferase [Sphingomonas sp. PL-96]MCC2975441.1 FAD:protein FMN transferase [Sphingomonas sp. PL-96]
MIAEAGIERFAAMGTRVELHRFDGRTDDALAAARRAIEAVDDALTIHRPSPATALNEALLAGRPAVIEDTLLFEALEAAADGHAATDGLFDIAADGRTRANWSLVELDRRARRIAVQRPVAFDFGGLGKGLALDRAVAILRAAGVGSALLTLGESSIAVLGEHPLGGGWPFAIPHPDDPDEELLTVELRDQALSISATVGAGTRAPERAAITRPHTGTAVAAPLCAVAVEPTGALAEVMSTALIAADEDAAARLLRGRAGSRFRFDLASTAQSSVAGTLAA